MNLSIVSRGDVGGDASQCSPPQERPKTTTAARDDSAYSRPTAEHLSSQETPSAPTRTGERARFRVFGCLATLLELRAQRDELISRHALEIARGQVVDLQQ